MTSQEDLNNAQKLSVWKPTFPLDSHGKMNFSSILIAKRKSGKTYLINYLYSRYWWNRYDLIFCYTNGAGVEEYSQFLDTKYIYPEFLPEQVEAIRAFNATLAGESKVNVLIIMDDTCSRRQRFDLTIQDLFNKGRHDNISIVYTTQDGSLVDNTWKENCDYIFMYKALTMRTKQYIIDNIITGMIPNLDFHTVAAEKRFYLKLLKKITQPRYQMIVADMDEGDLYKFKAGKLRRVRRSQPN